MVSFYPPASQGLSSIVSYTITPYLAGLAQAPTTVAVGSLTTISLTYTYSSITSVSANSPLLANSVLQAPVSGLTNNNSYTFTVKANNTQGASPESAQTGVALPLSGLIFGDEFAGPAGGPIDPAWWIYNRAGDFGGDSGYCWYLPSQVALDGNSNLVFTGTPSPYTGMTYPSWPGGAQNVTFPYRSGGMQSNILFMPSSGNTLSIDWKWQELQAISSNTQFHTTVWTHGSAGLNEWRIDPEVPATNGYNNNTMSDVSICEWGVYSGDDTTTFIFSGNCYSTWETYQYPKGPTDFAAGPNVWNYKWKPSVKRSIALNGGSVLHTDTTQVPTTGVFFLVWNEVQANGNWGVQTASADYIHVFDQNLG